MSATFKAALVQLNATEDMAANIETASGFVREAAAGGAKLVMLPENSVMMTFGADNVRANAKAEVDHPAIPAFQALAKETGVWLHAGTLAIYIGGAMHANRSYLMSPDGEIAATYDKIHMFDVDLSEAESYRESDTFQPGRVAVTADLLDARMGLTTCYDVRFPHLYRKLAQRGADLLAVPAAFTRTTGRAHWNVLLRARAIENGAYVLAAAQTGDHAGGRQTYGHSLIVNPWGEVIADAGEAPGIVTADIDLAEVKEARRRIPSLKADRDF